MTLSPALQSVLDLFNGPLQNVRFADIDAAGLAKLASEVEAAAAEVEELEAKLSELRQGLAQRQEALHQLAQQGLAYARVYAENDEALLEELNRISLPRVGKPRKPVAKAGGARESAASELADPAPALDAAPSANSAEGSALLAPAAAPAAEAVRTVRKGRPRAAQPSAS